MQVQHLVQHLAEVKAARDALEARLAALSAGEVDVLTASRANDSAHGNSDSGSTVQKVLVNSAVFCCVQAPTM